MKNISDDVRKNPIDLDYSQNLWDGKLLSHHLAMKYDIALGTRQCQRLFRKLKFRLRKRRPKIAKGDDDRGINLHVEGGGPGTVSKVRR